jgi:hypothetical protein
MFTPCPLSINHLHPIPFLYISTTPYLPFPLQYPNSHLYICLGSPAQPHFPQPLALEVAAAVDLELNDSKEGAMDKAYWLGLRAHYAIAHHNSMHEIRNKRGNGAPTRSPTPLWLGMSRSIDTQTWPSCHWLHLIRPRKLDHTIICHLHRLLMRNLLWSYSYEVVSLIWHPKHWLRYYNSNMHLLDLMTFFIFSI